MSWPSTCVGRRSAIGQPPSRRRRPDGRRAVASKASRPSTSSRRRVEGGPTVDEQPPSRRRHPDGRRRAAPHICWGLAFAGAGPRRCRRPAARAVPRGRRASPWSPALGLWRPRGRRARARQAALLFWILGKRGAAAPLARRPRSVPRGVSPTCSREFSADYLSLKSVRGPSTSFHPKSAESRLPGAREPSSGKVQLRVAVVSAAILHLASGGLACVHRTPRAAAGTSCPDPRTLGRAPSGPTRVTNGR